MRVRGSSAKSIKLDCAGFRKMSYFINCFKIFIDFFRRCDWCKSTLFWKDHEFYSKAEVLTVTYELYIFSSFGTVVFWRPAVSMKVFLCAALCLWVFLRTGNGWSPSWMTNPSTRWVRTCRPSGHAFGSQGALSGWLKLSDSSPDWPRSSASVSVSAGRCDSPPVFSTLSGSGCDRLRSAGWAGWAGSRGGGLSDEGTMKGEEGGDWEERLDSAGGTRQGTQSVQ